MGTDRVLSHSNPSPTRAQFEYLQSQVPELVNGAGASNGGDVAELGLTHAHVTLALQFRCGKQAILEAAHSAVTNAVTTVAPASAA